VERVWRPKSAFGIADAWGEMRVQRVAWWREEVTRIWARTVLRGGEQGSESHRTGPHRPVLAQTSMRAANKATKTRLVKAAMATKSVSSSIQSRAH